MQRTDTVGALSLYQGYLLTPEAAERGRVYIKSRGSRMVTPEAIAEIIKADMRPVTPWNGSTPATAAVAAARFLVWEACQRKELREVRGAWGHTFWQPVR